MVDAIPYYHCQLCIQKRSRSFINYISHRREDVILGGNTAIEKLFFTWKRKNEKGKEILESFDDRVSNKILPAVHSFTRRGIINDGSNCWLNSILQVICGSSIKYLLPQGLRKTDDLADSLFKLSALIAKNGDPIPTSTYVTYIANRIAMPLAGNDGKQMGHQDTADGYAQIMTALFSMEESLHVEDNFMATRIELKNCLTCKDVTGEIQREFMTFIDVIRCKSNQSVTLKDAIWNEFTGKYELNEKYHCRRCAGNKVNEKVLLMSFFFTAPNVITFGVQGRSMPIVLVLYPTSSWI